MTKEQSQMNRGAQLERRAMRAWLKRRLKCGVGYSAEDVLLVFGEFLKHRQKLTNAKAGGLGRK